MPRDAADPSVHPPAPLKVLHFVTGGFSGATQVAIDLARSAAEHGQQALLVLRRKRHTPPARVQALRDEALDVHVVPGWSHAATIASLAALCRRERPDLLLAHGFPEHLLGRWAAWWAGVPAMLQVEHNSRERYTVWRRAQSRWLARRSARLVAVSPGVRDAMLAGGLPADRIVTIANGIDLGRFALAAEHPFAGRVPGIVMAARFSGQKDHATALRALALLRERGHRPPLVFAGGGDERRRRAAQRLCDELGLQAQVRFAGHVADLPGLLMRHRIGLLSTRYEGMPLSLIEAMAAGCAAVASDVPGVGGLLEPGVEGLLVPGGDARALADALAGLLDDPLRAAALAEAGRRAALARHAIEDTRRAYAALCRACARPAAGSAIIGP